LANWNGNNVNRPPWQEIPHASLAITCYNTGVLRSYKITAADLKSANSRRKGAIMTRPSPHPMPRRLVLLAPLAIGAVGRSANGQAPAQEDPWPALSAQIFDGKTLQDGSAILTIDAPYRAEDAALVPIAIRTQLPADDARSVRAITLVIDENPSPVAAVFSPGAASGMRSLSTRVRVDSYTNIHAVAELSDGQLYATQRFVKAAGGCSAPAAKEEADSIPLGTMRFRQFPDGPGQDPERREAQLMIRHPNYSGMQMDQLTRLYVPAHFVQTVHLWLGDTLLLGVESGISISENPVYRFDYHPNGATEFRAEMKDSEGRTFSQQWSATRA
jgi:sulfur-oxidizing protein SoxY